MVHPLVLTFVYGINKNAAGQKIRIPALTDMVQHLKQNADSFDPFGMKQGEQSLPYEPFGLRIVDLYSSYGKVDYLAQFLGLGYPVKIASQKVTVKVDRKGL